MTAIEHTVMPPGVQIRRAFAESECSPSVRGMMTLTELAFVPSDPLAPFTDRLRLAATSARVVY
jgi:hypothetical protein